MDCRAIARTVCLLIAVLAAGCTPAAAAPRSRFTCCSCYDADYFYIAVSVDKPSLRGSQTAPFSNPPGDDAIAVFLQSPASPVGPRRTATSVEMVVSVAGGAQLYRGAEAVALKGFADFLSTPEGGRVPFKYGVVRRGEIGAPGAPDTGYVVEMAIPWLEVGGAPAVGARMRFNVAALSTSPDTSAIISMAPGVHTLDDLQNPALWGEIVFVDAPVRTVATAPDARVSARMFTAKPLMNGILSPGEWSSVTSFSQAEPGDGGAPAAVSSAVARVRPAVTLAAPDAVLPIAPPAPAAPRARVKQAVPRLVLAPYRYDVQADPRKAAPSIPAQAANGSSLLVDHPFAGCGPWMSYDRVDWHATQLEQARLAGIDVLLPVYGASVRERQRYSARGLGALVAALRSLAATGRDHPVLAALIDVPGLPEQAGGSVDLGTPVGRERLYAAIRDFTLQVPRAFRASVPLSVENGGGLAAIAVIGPGAGLTGADGSLLAFLRERYRAEFGDDLIVLGADTLKAAGLDGTAEPGLVRGTAASAGGWIRVATVGVAAAAAEGAPAGGPVLRRDGSSYRDNLRAAVAGGPDWIVLGEWNDYRGGAGIAPTEEYGFQYTDMTRAAAIAFEGGGALSASVLAHTVPAVVTVGATWMATVRLANTGTRAWTPQNFAMAYRWSRSPGAAFDEARIVPLARRVLPGQAATLSFPLRVPAAAGDYVVRIDLAEVNAKGDITAYFGGPGGRTATVPARVVAADDATAPKYALSVVSSDLPSAAEAGGTYQVKLAVRNDGRETWRGGAARLVAHVMRAVSSINTTAEADALVSVPIAGASAAVPADVPPGQIAVMTVPVTFSRPDGAPLAAWTPADNWTYMLRWEVRPAADAADGAATTPDAVLLIDADTGAQIDASLCPDEMPAERRIPVRLSVRNSGPQTWRKDVTRVGYHWYYQDGVECVWEDETTAIPQDVPPGGVQPGLVAWVTPPPYDGIYWLEWDLKCGDTWISTEPGVRATASPVRRVRVNRGKLTFVEMAPVANAAAITGDGRPGSVSFAPGALTLPAERVPPLASGDLACAGIWGAVPGAGLDSSRRIAFKWAPRAEGEKGAIECRGQTVPITADPRGGLPCKVLHLLAASVGDAATVAITLRFSDGSEQYSSFPVGRWDGGAANGEEAGFVAPYTRTASGGTRTDRPATLYRYAIRTGEARKLVSIVLPRNPDVKVFAITAER